MPFVEILGFEKAVSRRRRAAEALTRGLAEAYGISPDIISVYFVGLDGIDYAHAGVLDPGSDKQRVFVKLHAFTRDEDLRAAAAAAMTRAIAEAWTLRPKDVVIYFLDRDRSEVAHDGILQNRLT